MSIDDYCAYLPTDIFTKFERVNEIKPLNEIKEKLFTNMRKELTEASSTCLLSKENKHIRRFEAAVKHLPKVIRQAL
jgi:hypothetical protein